MTFACNGFHLDKSGKCHIEQGSSTKVGTPTFEGASQTAYSCVANENCEYDVHVIGNYESNGRHGFGIERTAGTTNVNIVVSGTNQGTKPLILVFVSYEPVKWILSIPSGVVIERILLVKMLMFNKDIYKFIMMLIYTTTRDHTTWMIPQLLDTALSLF